MRTANILRLSFNVIGFAAIAIFLGADTPAYAHDCLQRIQAILHTISPPDTAIEDCMRTGWFQAGLTCVAATAVAGLIVQQLISTMVRADPQIADTSVPWNVRPDHWPKDLTGPNAFKDLGRTIRDENGYKALDNDIDRANYIFERFRKAAAVYDFRASPELTDNPLGQISVGLSRPEHRPAIVGAVLGAFVVGVAAMYLAPATLIGGAVSWLATGGGGYLGYKVGQKMGEGRSGDPENADSLKKGAGSYGNCGEISYAFQNVADGAGVTVAVVFADSNPTNGMHSPGFGGTDTAVLLKTSAPSDPKQKVQLIFDPFRQLFSMPGNNQSDPSDWAGLPATSADVRPGVGPQTAWLGGKIKGKHCIKDVAEKVIFKDDTLK